MAKREVRPGVLVLEAGFRPLQSVRWYKRMAAWGLSRGNRRYDALVAGRKAALFGPLAGTVVEIGPGAGNNLPFLSPLASSVSSSSSRGPGALRWIGVEPNPYFEPRLRARAAELGLVVDVRAGTAEALPVADASADAVIASLVLCTVRDPAGALREVRRVLRPGGRFVFLEHVAAELGTAPRLVQRILRPIWSALADGCHPDRDTARLIESAGFQRLEMERFRLPVPVMGRHIAGVAWA